jgi:hypothetical protein
MQFLEMVWMLGLVMLVGSMRFSKGLPALGRVLRASLMVCALGVKSLVTMLLPVSVEVRISRGLMIRRMRVLTYLNMLHLYVLPKSLDMHSFVSQIGLLNLMSKKELIQLW